MNRRKFAGTIAAASAAQASSPTRSTPLVPTYWGPEFYDEQERQQLADVLSTGRPFRYYGPGTQAPVKVATFEKELAARIQTKFALAVTSGTAALEVAMAALQIGPGDEVIVPAWTWHSSATAVIRAGALPVFAEIDESFNLDPTRIEPLITKQTKLLMAVHLQGCPADMDPILALARRHGLRVLEDCAQAAGASYKGKPLGSLGDIAIFSHQINKTISAGEGGSLVTNDPVFYERAVRFHDLGGLRAVHAGLLGQPTLAPFAGANYRMNEFTGGVMLAQLRKLDRIVDSIRANAKRVYEGVADLPGIRFRHRPDPAGELGAAVFLAFANKAKRDQFISGMKAENVPVAPPSGSVVLPVLPYILNKLTAHPAWPTWTSARGKSIQYGPATCPRTLDILNRFAGPALDPKYTRRDLDDIIAAIRKVYPTVI